MNNKNEKDKKTEELRRRAEKFIGGKFDEIESVSNENARKFIHELHVHQIELEMQNEELREAQQTIEESRSKYFDLFDLAPVGYFTISEKGLIVDANLTGAAMLGVERRQLINKPLSNFITPDSQDTFYIHRKKVFETERNETCELKMTRLDGSAFNARFESVLGKDADGGAAQLRTSVIDITEQRHAEQELRESEARYHSLFNNMNEGFSLNEIICDELGNPVDYRFLDVNPAFEKLTGLKRAQVVGKRVREALPGIEQFWIEKFGRTALSGEPVRFENFTASLGRWYEVFAYRPAEKQFAVVFTDVTERRRADEEIRNIAKFPLENPYPVMRIQRQGTIIFANAASRPFLDEWNSAVGDSLPDDWKKIIIHASETGERQITERKIGTRRYEFHVVPVRDTEYVNLYGNDITHLKQIQYELREHKNNLENLVRTRTEELREAYKELSKKQESLTEAQRIGRIGNWDWNILTNELLWSDEIYRIFGLQAHEFAATYDAFLESVHLEDRDFVTKSVIDAIEQKIPYSIDHRIVMADGTQKIVHQEGEIIHKSGRAVRMVGTVQDVTERKLIEDALKEREKQLEMLTRMVITSHEEERTKICRNLHDELGQRLTAMGMEIQWLAKQESIKQEDVNNLGEILEVINKDLQRIYKGLQPMALDKLGLKAALESLIWDYKDHYNLKIHSEIEDPACKADEERTIIIYRILQEALTNIVRHAGAEEVKIGLRQNGEYIIIEITDDGAGFDPNESSGRTGMGLIGMRERAAMFDGALYIDTKPGRGTRIIVKITAQ